MNDTEHLLTVLMEECAEVAKECAKALRFGLDDKLTRDPHGPRVTEGLTNREKIVEELNDLLGVVQMLVDRCIIHADWRDLRAQIAKRERVRSFMGYARRVGTLDAAPETQREEKTP